ncbi:hypothetical protein CALCODRAFT_87776 [Calocera cornea HHB12733]|uniref:Uncharacterized protein n=1 Tax=Calocera cornea HHB12733 TaxID=1353952 RepID=A0A165DCE7_9BASI|nr:hypothetical protein CALCODRAFT_87776 [Calocera cornea HHB12733]
MASARSSSFGRMIQHTNTHKGRGIPAGRAAKPCTYPADPALRALRLLSPARHTRHTRDARAQNPRGGCLFLFCPPSRPGALGASHTFEHPLSPKQYCICPPALAIVSPFLPLPLSLPLPVARPLQAVARRRCLLSPPDATLHTLQNRTRLGSFRFVLAVLCFYSIYLVVLPVGS